MIENLNEEKSGGKVIYLCRYIISEIRIFNQKCDYYSKTWFRGQ